MFLDGDCFDLDKGTCNYGEQKKQEKITSGVKDGVINSLLHHTLATDHRKNLPFNLDNLRTRQGLLGDLKEKDNLLYEGKDWAVSTTIGPYGSHHIMLIYTGDSQEIFHLGQIPNNQMSEYYEILSQLLTGLEKSYSSSIESGDLNLYYGLNHSLVPGGGKSQSVFRPHTHIVFIDNKEKQEEFHKIEKLSIHDGEKCNRGMLAFNKQNLALIKDFEQCFLDINIKKFKKSLIISEDEYYAIDLPLPGKFSNKETIEIFEKMHSEGREFLDAINKKDKRLIREEVFSALGYDIDKIGFSIGFYEENGISHLRFRFSFKNPGENAGVLESMGHAINRDEKLGEILPDMSEIRGYVKKILSN